MSAWKPFSGNSAPKNIYSFKKPGDELEGLWQGARRGKFATNGVVASGGRRNVFNLSTELQALQELDIGSEVRIIFKGWRKTDSGRKRKEFEIYRRSSAPGAVHSEVERAEGFAGEKN